MNNNEKTEAFLLDVKNYLLAQKLSKATINNYLSKIKKLLKNEYTVNDLCGNIDQLIEDYGHGGRKYNPADKGQTKAVLGYVRKMRNGKLISSLQISYKKDSGGVWVQKEKHITAYLIENEKITFSFNSTTKTTKKISPVNMGMLINILQQAQQHGFLCDEGPVFLKESSQLTDAPPFEEYEYSFNGSHGQGYSIIADGTEPQRESLKNQYNLLIEQLAFPFKL